MYKLTNPTARALNDEITTALPFLRSIKDKKARGNLARRINGWLSQGIDCRFTNAVEVSLYIDPTKRGDEMYGGSQPYGGRAHLFDYMDHIGASEDWTFFAHIPYGGNQTVRFAHGGVFDNMTHYLALSLSDSPHVERSAGYAYIEEVKSIRFTTIEQPLFSKLYIGDELWPALNPQDHRARFVQWKESYDARQREIERMEKIRSAQERFIDPFEY